MLTSNSLLLSSLQIFVCRLEYTTLSKINQGVAVRFENDASPCGDMMHLLRKYDVAPFGRNDVMFACHANEVGFA